MLTFLDCKISLQHACFSLHPFSQPNFLSSCTASYLILNFFLVVRWFPFLHFFHIPPPHLQEIIVGSSKWLGQKEVLGPCVTAMSLKNGRKHGPHCKVHGLIVFLNYFPALGGLFSHGWWKEITFLRVVVRAEEWSMNSRSGSEKRKKRVKWTIKAPLKTFPLSNLWVNLW